jgi:hypothetical protein
MKKIMSLLLAMIMMISAVSGLNTIAYASDDEECCCCSDCMDYTGDEECYCGCELCNYCSEDEDGEDEDVEDEVGEDEESEDDSEKFDVSLNYNAEIEGKDPEEKDTEYTAEEKTADLEQILSYQYCGDSMFWYVKSNTLVVFGRGRMYDYKSYSETPWSNLKYTHVIIRTGVTHISNYAFFGTKIQSVVLPSTVKVIGDNAFANCIELREVKFGKGLQSVGERAFFNCRSLKKLTINNHLQYLGESAFEHCISLVSVRFPSTLEVIEAYSFQDCTSLKKVTLRTNLIEIKSSAFSNCITLSNINFPDTLAIIGNRVFNKCVSLKTAYLGEYLSAVGTDAFAFSGLESVAIKSNVKMIDVTAFLNCSAEVRIYKNATAYKALKSARNISVICAEHDAKITTNVKASFSRSGEKGGSVCAACGQVISSTAIAQIFSVSLSKTEFTYNGKAQIPTVTATDINKKTIPAKFYTKKCTAGTQNVGKYAITVTFNGDYEGSKTVYYTIKPAKPSFSKLTAQSKALKVEWKKQTAQVTGFQIQYSTSSGFGSAKTITVSKNSTTAYTIKSLSAKKKYYVRIRTYKTVDGKNYYSDWCAAKNTTTKA